MGIGIQITCPPPSRPRSPSPPPSKYSAWNAFISPFLSTSPLVPVRWKDDNEKIILDVGVSRYQKAKNLIGCIVVTIAFFRLILFSRYGFLIDIGLAIFLAEYCEWSNKSLHNSSAEGHYQSKATNPLDLAEKGSYFQEVTNKQNHNRCIASVVGYREDPAIFTRALESYAQADSCSFILTCIDGNESGDQDMVDVFQNVFPTNSATLNLPIALAQIALQIDQKQFSDNDIVNKCVSYARKAFLEHGINFHRPSAITRLCITQPHMHKKGVMFTSFIVSIALSEILGIEFLWTSDSDSMVHKNTLKLTFDTIAGDEDCAGGSTALTIHNRHESMIAMVGHVVFLNDLHLSRCYSGAVGANDCQSGPCAAFRIKCLAPELLVWYKQTIWGHWMIINEDRHLTTRLLLRGYRIAFIPNAITETESPITLRRWILQQLRWARSGHIETYSNPAMYLNHSPILFLGAVRRQLSALFNVIELVRYAYTGQFVFPLSVAGFLYRIIFTLFYLGIRNPIRPSWREWCWSLPAAVIYHVPLPAIQIWSLLTVFADSWGTSMRGNKETPQVTRWQILKAKVWELAFFVVWMGVIGGAIGSWVGAQAELYELQAQICTGVGMTAMWGGFAYWIVVVE